MLGVLLYLWNILQLILSVPQGFNVIQIASFFLFISILLSQSYATDSLRFIKDVNFATGTKFLETEIGGLSGITFDKQQNKFLAISDDRSNVNEARLYEFDITLTNDAMSATPSKVIKLKKSDGSFYRKNEVDFEGISLYDGDILVSSEGTRIQIPPTLSQLYRFSRVGVFKGLVSVPEKFQSTGSRFFKLSGTRDNKGFETLSTSLDGKVTMMAAEDALFQDGKISSLSHASTTRIIIYKNLQVLSEVPYILEKLEGPKSAVLDLSDNGLVDIAVIDDKNFYALERMWIAGLNKNIIRIFKCKISNHTTDISKIKSLKAQKIKAVEKVLVADLSNFQDQMNPKSLDNIEGMSFGPKLSNGSETLILVSDNNFNPNQRTLFIAFEIIKD